MSLRRVDLWRKIRGKEPRPQDVTDRAWRSLRKELRNPATIRKSMLCSKANVARTNFGRKGLSREVGVRERLRRQLRRSLHLEEIHAEMVCDNGYGGLSKQQMMLDCVMHDRDQVTPLAAHEANANDGTGSESDDNTEDAGFANSPGVPNMVEDQITTNPLDIIKLMDRILALEDSLRRKCAEVESLMGKKISCEVEVEHHVEASTGELRILSVEGIIEKEANAVELAKDAANVNDSQGQVLEATESPDNLEELHGHGEEWSEGGLNPKEICDTLGTQKGDT